MWTPKILAKKNRCLLQMLCILVSNDDLGMLVECSSYTIVLNGETRLWTSRRFTLSYKTFASQYLLDRDYMNRAILVDCFGIKKKVVFCNVYTRTMSICSATFSYMLFIYIPITLDVRLIHKTSADKYLRRIYTWNIQTHHWHRLDFKAKRLGVAMHCNEHMCFSSLLIRKQDHNTHTRVCSSYGLSVQDQPNLCISPLCT